MSDHTVALYEGLFLMSPTASGNLADSLSHISEILARASAEVLVLKKWDERKLAYPIHGQKRGLFLLTFFKAKAAQIANIDRDCNLSEQVVRALIVKADYAGDVEVEAAKKEEVFTQTEVKLREPAPVAAPEEGVDALAD